MDGYTENVWKDIELRIDPYHLCTSYHISSMKKNWIQNPLNPKAPFTWVFMDIILETAPNVLASETNFSNYLLIVDAHSKNPKLYGMNKITTKEVMDKSGMFQYRFGKIN